MKFKLIYEDNHLIVVDKPVNILSQSDKTGDMDLVTAIKEYIKTTYDKPGNVFLGLVQRLDRPVGGIMVFAKTSKAASRLSEQIRNGSFKKEYFAVIHGNLEKSKNELINYLYKDKENNFVKIVNSKYKNAKKAVLRYEMIEEKSKLTLVKIKLITGRAHQIRVQMQNINHPLWGDQKYGIGLSKRGQQLALWSNKIIFEHPTKKDIMTFESNPDSKYPWSNFDRFIKR